MKQLSKTLFLDIETVSQYREYDEMDPSWAKAWQKKHNVIFRNDPTIMTPEQSYTQRAAIYSEFGKIICISVGYLNRQGEEDYELRTKSFSGDDEEQILRDFAKLIDEHFYSSSQHHFCGHNIREFDIPYVCRRMIIHGLKIPEILDVRGKKPWEVKYFLDTLEQWKFGDYKAFVSLDLLTQTLGVPSPKDGIDGSEVGNYYYEKQDLESIVAYCERDVRAVVDVMLRMCALPALKD